MIFHKLFPSQRQQISLPETASLMVLLLEIVFEDIIGDLAGRRVQI